MPAKKKKEEPTAVETVASKDAAEVIANAAESMEPKDEIAQAKALEASADAAPKEPEEPPADLSPEETDDFGAELTDAEKAEKLLPVSVETVSALLAKEKPADNSDDVPSGEQPPDEKPKKTKKPARTPKKTINGLNLNELDRNLSPEEQQEWSAIYASYRSKSILSGAVIGRDENTLDVTNRSTGETERKTLSSLIIIDYRVKVLIPESEIWAPGEERPDYVMRNMIGSKIDYVILEVDREGGCAIGSRRMALAAKRHFFSTSRFGHEEGERLKCHVLAVGAKRCLLECNGYDLRLSQRDLSYTAIPDLREKYRPGQELDCLLKGYDKESGRLLVSVKETQPHPFDGASKRHPIGSRRQAVISGKYGGGIFCTMPDDTVCLCLYSTQHEDINFSDGDNVLIVIRQYDYERHLIFGRILSKW